MSDDILNKPIRQFIPIMRDKLKINLTYMSINDLITAINTLQTLNLNQLNNDKDKNRKIEILKEILTELNQRDIPEGNENDDVYKTKLNELKVIVESKLNELKNISGGSVVKRKKKSRVRSKSRKRSKSRGKSKRK